MTIPAALLAFIEDELLRAPLLIEQAVEAVLEQLRKTLPSLSPAERSLSADLVQALTNKRVRVVEAYVRSLRTQVEGQFAAGGPADTPAKAASALSMSLSLVDEAEVAVDVEMSHAIEGIKSVAEYELRELQTYTSALVGDMDVARDHNPFRPETHARALWTAAQSLAASLGFQVAFMRQAGMPMAQVLRKSYAAACARLESSGVAPAAYRTMILPAGARRERRHEATFVPELSSIRESMPVPVTGSGPAGPGLDQVLRNAEQQLRLLPPDSERAAFEGLRNVQRTQLVASAGSPVDQQLIELLSRLFDAILADHKLAPDLQLLVSRLQASALRVALRDASTLDSYAHPVWLFLDRLAFQAELLPAIGDAERTRMRRHARALVEHLIAEPVHDAELYRWALGRLEAFERSRLEQRCATAASEITSLQALEVSLGSTVSPPSTCAGAMDVAQLDTVPAELFDAAGPATQATDGESADWLAQRQRGDWVRIVLQGHWVHAQLLWPGEHGEIWLLADSRSEHTWAVRRGALLALRAANLLDALKPRSLLRDAAKQVLKRLNAANGH